MEANMSEPLVSQLQAVLASIHQQIGRLEQRKGAIEQVLATYDPAAVTISNGEAGLSSIEMARLVLADYGSPLGTAEIRRRIQRKFGVMPASSLQQMLYMRAARNQTFFNAHKKYGLIEWKTK
jgi:hypothetical protein